MTTLLNTAQARELSAASTPLRRTTIVFAICIALSTLSLAASLISLRTASPRESSVSAPASLSDIVEQLERRPSIFLVPKESAKPLEQPPASDSAAAMPASDIAMIDMADAFVAVSGPANPQALPADEPREGTSLVEASDAAEDKTRVSPDSVEREVASATIAKQEIEAAIANATQTLVDRLRELERRLNEARTRDLEPIVPEQTTIETHVDKAADSEPVPSRLVPESPLPVAAPTSASSSASSSPTPVSKPYDSDPTARTLGVEVAEGYRCNDRHCQGRHLRVTSVGSNSPATRLRCSDCGRHVALSTGDVIIRVNSSTVTSVESLRKSLDQPGRVVLHVVRGDGSHKDLVLEN